nr:hypothetical transcript [Hymenolepis microstoma]
MLASATPVDNRLKAQVFFRGVITCLPSLIHPSTPFQSPPIPPLPHLLPSIPRNNFNWQEVVMVVEVEEEEGKKEDLFISLRLLPSWNVKNEARHKQVPTLGA